MAADGRDIIVIGASAGGVVALQTLVAALPADIPASIFMVLHVWPSAESQLPAILSRMGPLPAVEARDGLPIERGRIYVAPADSHLFVEANRVAVLRGPKENRARPAINPLFRSAAAAHRNRVAGVILTGMLDDGVAGLWAVKQCGGVAIVQSDAQFPDMPRAAMENVAVDYSLPLAQIPGLLDGLARKPVVASTPPVAEVVRVNNAAAHLDSSASKLDRIGQRTTLTCPDCHGVLWETEEGEPQFRCHVGHAYGPGFLAKAQAMNIEQSLRSALRALKESAALDERVAERAADHQLAAAAESHRRNARAKLDQAEQLQGFIRALRTES